jgi:hypothetical protein
MTWGNVKKRIEAAGVTDDTEMNFIDIAGDQWCCETEWGGGAIGFGACHGDPPDDGLGDAEEPADA